MTIIFFVVILVLVARVQYLYDETLHPLDPKKIMFRTETRYVMPPQVMKNLAFGFNNVLADIYWINLIQDFSIWNGKDTFYLDEYRNVSILDQNFSYPYLLGILTFTSRSFNYKSAPGMYPVSIETFEPIAIVGMKNLPNDWEIPFYLGTAYQLNKKPEKATLYLRIAANNPNAPEIVKKVYDTYIQNILKGTDAGTPLIRTIYETTGSEATKKIVEESLVIKAISSALTLVVEDYKSKFGRYPKLIHELAQKNMIINETELNRDYIISINQKTGEVSVVPRAKQ